MHIRVRICVCWGMYVCMSIYLISIRTLLLKLELCLLRAGAPLSLSLLSADVCMSPHLPDTWWKRSAVRNQEHRTALLLVTIFLGFISL